MECLRTAAEVLLAEFRRLQAAATPFRLEAEQRRWAQQWARPWQLAAVASQAAAALQAAVERSAVAER